MQVANYAIYQMQLRSSYLTRVTKAASEADDLGEDAYHFSPILRLPDREQIHKLLGEAGRSDLLKEAEEILSGYVSLFGGEPIPLELGPAHSDTYWTDLERMAGRGAGFRPEADLGTRAFWLGI